MNKCCLLGLCLVLASPAMAEDASGLPELTQEELEQYQFEVDRSDVSITELSIGQRYVLDTQRREIKDLIARRLGVLSLRDDGSTIRVLQRLVDEKVIPPAETRDWQSLGVVFGDILVHDFGLHWVSYEDSLGESKALRWKDTDNFVFPVTLFSKRVQFEEKIDVRAIYDKLAAEIESFKAYERSRPEFK